MPDHAVASYNIGSNIVHNWLQDYTKVRCTAHATQLLPSAIGEQWTVDIQSLIESLGDSDFQPQRPGYKYSMLHFVTPRPPTLPFFITGLWNSAQELRLAHRWSTRVSCCQPRGPWSYSAPRLPGNAVDRDLESDRDMEHESDTGYPPIDNRYLNNKHSN